MTIIEVILIAVGLSYGIAKEYNRTSLRRLGAAGTTRFRYIEEANYF
jgi:hypothetical protein